MGECRDPDRDIRYVRIFELESSCDTPFGFCHSVRCAVDGGCFWRGHTGYGCDAGRWSAVRPKGQADIEG